MANTSLIFDIFAKDHNVGAAFKGITAEASAAGKAMGQSLDSGKLANLRKDLEIATNKVKIAEMGLDEVNRNSSSTARQKLAAENAVLSARQGAGRATDALAKAEAEAAAASEKHSISIKQSLEGIGNAGSKMGKTLTAALSPLGLGGGLLAGLGLVEFAKGVGDEIKAAGDFEAANTRLVTSAGESAGNLKMVSDGILEVAKATGTATDELEKGAYYIESAGFHGADMLTVLKAAAQGAKAEGSSVETVGDAVTSALRDYHMTASDAADVTSKMITAVGDGKTTFELFAGSLHSVLPVAATAHVSLSDILGDLASMTVHGMSADQATQNLNHTIMKLINPTQQQTSEFALLGTTSQEVQSKLGSSGLSGTLDFLHDKIVNAMPPGSEKVLLNMKTAISELDPKIQDFATHLVDGSMGWKDWIKQAIEMDPVQEKNLRQLDTLLGQTHKLGNEQKDGSTVLQNYAQAWRLATGDQTGASVAMMLTGENAEYTHKAVQDVSNASKDASGNVKGWTEIQDTFNNKLDRAKEVFETTAIKIGTKLLPTLGDALGKFTEFVNGVAPLLSGLWEKDIAPALDSIAKSILGTLGDQPGDATGDAADGFGSAMTKVGTNADGTIGKDGTVARAAKEFGTSMQQVADSIKQVTDFLPQLDTAANNLMHGLDEPVSQIHNWFVTTIQDMVTTDETWDTRVGSMILNAENLRWQIIENLANFGEIGITAGENLISGIITGINNAIGNLGGPLADVLQFIRDHKGPESVDRALLVPHGGWIMDGLVKGIEGGIPNLHSSLRRVTATVAGTAMVGSGIGGSSAFTAGAPAVHVYIGNEQLDARMYKVAGNAIDGADFRAGRRPSL